MDQALRHRISTSPSGAHDLKLVNLNLKTKHSPKNCCCIPKIFQLLVQWEIWTSVVLRTTLASVIKSRLQLSATFSCFWIINHFDSSTSPDQFFGTLVLYSPQIIRKEEGWVGQRSFAYLKCTKGNERGTKPIGAPVRSTLNFDTSCIMIFWTESFSASQWDWRHRAPWYRALKAERMNNKPWPWFMWRHTNVV